ncbi:adenylate cyclase type 10-like [Polistes fuscatus]|uniref:adenylate cyclase type 10-like n=1 Tax=Polistes fuscatus TaxID=30207 RepID=UPI001CA8E977|nr:adenylate cyclase type 10-like [Polistes fuscatus]
MCPDEILDDYNNYEIRKYLTTLMLGDISGFTHFAEKYTRTGKGGASKLTEILNSYIGAMVQEILSHNGDLLKFSGDAFIVMWKLKDNANMRDLATIAIQTACIIQKNFGAYETDVGITLRVKLAIASGKTYFTCIGDPKKMSHYMIIGKPVWEVKNAERLCKYITNNTNSQMVRGGDILVALSAWRWVNPIEYVYETLPDGLHTLIIACSTMWYTLKSPYTYDNGKIIIKQSLTFYYLTQNCNAIISIKFVIKMNDLYFSVRPKIVEISKAQLKDALRSYMLKPVIRSVEMDEPLEYLTEMRQVVIVFVNAIVSEMRKKQLIKLVDAAYKLVCRTVDRMQGCVNKTSLFDKDLTFLCIFGLRGDKHELESQIGLKCAYRLRIGLKELACITSVTVGVTTGMTYCGVIGHILRREYTVIGMTVNKAARLMMGYNNKVICDRESFLHSRLEVSHFKLQEPKYLKGITDIGPVYEFEEQVKYKESELVWRKYPLLGRDNEMNIFRSMLANLVKYVHIGNDASNKPQYNTLIIRGEPRIGKSRLLDEMALNIPSGIPSNYISLVSTDIQNPYTLVHLIFSLPLKFSLTSTPKDREEKLIRLLGNVRHPEYLCALNQVFNVSFPMTKRYRSFMELEKQKILEQLLINLTKKCFSKFWVIIIDDVEYADKESLNVFDIFIKTNMFLFIISVGRKEYAEYRLSHTLLEKTYIMELQGIDKWYHIGIVCQVLNVVGISPELEKLIQNRSLGNPGWIESYLMTLMQSGNLAIITVTRREAENMGYVLPNVKMLKRRTLDNLLNNAGPVREDRWEMYETSYMDNTPLMSSNEMLLQSNSDLSNHEEISVAFSKKLDPFSIKNTNIEMTMDVIILKLFDSLTPLDQFLLKCASVLGIFINRKMLESITEISIKDTAVGKNKLLYKFNSKIYIYLIDFFDISDTFSKNVGPIIYYRNIHKHIDDIGVKCRCTDLVISEELSNMPKYASCGLIRFKMALFRDTTYGLLTENQKIELHNKALKFLQHNTRRCVACGKGHFANLLDTDIFSEVEEIPIHLEYPLKLRQLHNVNSSILPRIKNVISSRNSLSYLNVFKKPERKSTRTFSNLDFTNCQCNLILLTVYTQMVEHCYGIGRNDKTLIAILGFAEICIENQNVPQARKLLDEAETILQQMFDPNKNEVITFLYLTAKIQTLQGKCYFKYGHTSEAEKSLNKAMKTLGYNFPRMDITTDLKTAFQLMKLKLLLFCPRKRKSTVNGDDYVRKYTNQLACCLAQMFEVYKAKGMKKQARLAAIWALNTARPNNDFFILSTCYTNMLITAHVYRIKNIIISLENESIDLSNEETRIIEYQDFKVIVELYAGIFFSRWIRGQIKKAIDIGFIVMKLAKNIDLTYIQCIALPQLVHLLMISCRHSEVVSILRDLEFISKNNIDKSGRTWYYAICADVQLDIGFTILSYENCKRYYLKEGESMFSLRNPEAERRYFTSMWLWCVRNQEWEASKIWIKKHLKTNTTDEDIVAATITDLKKLEGLLISYVYYANKRDVKAIFIMADIKVSFKNIKKMISIVKIAIPRYVLIKAYYYMVRGHKRKAMKILQKTKKICNKMENKMIYKWAMHCKQAWEGKMSSIQQDLWQLRSTIISSSTWDEINTNNSEIIFYTLPIPNYVR